MTDYKYATEWLGYVSKSPPEEHGGFDLTTITGATTSLREILRLKRENALMRRWLKMAFVAEQFVRAHKEIERKMPDLFAGGKKGK